VGALSDQPKNANCSAVVLAGGLNTRMGGRNKALLDLGGRPVLAWLLESLRKNFTAIWLVTREPEVYKKWPVRVATDIYSARSSLTGIHAGLSKAHTPHIFAIACDTPFLQPQLTQLLVDQISAKQEAVVPFYDGHFQPLCAVYAKTCLPVVEKQLDAKQYKIIDFFDQLRIKKIDEKTLHQADPLLRSFLNINTPEMYQTCRQLL